MLCHYELLFCIDAFLKVSIFALYSFIFLQYVVCVLDRVTFLPNHILNLSQLLRLKEVVNFAHLDDFLELHLNSFQLGENLELSHGFATEFTVRAHLFVLLLSFFDQLNDRFVDSLDLLAC